jgi:hypothetical protein
MHKTIGVNIAMALSFVLASGAALTIEKNIKQDGKMTVLIFTFSCCPTNHIEMFSLQVQGIFPEQKQAHVECLIYTAKTVILCTVPPVS